MECSGVDPENIASHFLRWYRAGRIHGIGSSTLKAMKDLSVGAHWAVAGATGEYAAGNGVAMRVAPLAFVLDPGNLAHRALFRDVCRITHHSDEAYFGGLSVWMAIRAAVSGAWPQQSFLAAAAEGLPDCAVRDRIQELLPLELPVVEVASVYGATGHVVDTVPLALYSAQAIAKEMLPVVLERTIMIEGDTDTIASITGQVAGTVAGATGIPSELIDEIKAAEELRAIADAFADWLKPRA